MRGEKLFSRLLREDFATILDVGAGHSAPASRRLCVMNKQVTGIDFRPAFFSAPNYKHIRQDFYTWVEDVQHDVVWSSHVLEHVTDVGMFLRKLRTHVKPGGLIALVVPSDSQEEFREEHLTLWNPTLLLYNLVYAGLDCREAEWYTEGVDIGVLVKNVPTTPQHDRIRNHTDALEWLPIPFNQKMSSWIEDNWRADE